MTSDGMRTADEEAHPREVKIGANFLISYLGLNCRLVFDKRVLHSENIQQPLSGAPRRIALFSPPPHHRAGEFEGYRPLAQPLRQFARPCRAESRNTFGEERLQFRSAHLIDVHGTSV